MNVGSAASTAPPVNCHRKVARLVLRCGDSRAGHVRGHFRGLFMSDRFSASLNSFARLNVDEFATVIRRTLLRGLTASALLTTTGSFFTRGLWAAPTFSADPFTLGVASGDPAPDGFVLWTKIAPKPLERGGGMPLRPVEVKWTVATSERMRQVVREGTAVAHPELGHAVHVEVDRLEPARDYFYQFTIGGERSR